ncbi:hypothetical protein STEG23_020837, partial [Scotinomys teguina]
MPRNWSRDGAREPLRCVPEDLYDNLGVLEAYKEFFLLVDIQIQIVRYQVVSSTGQKM